MYRVSHHTNPWPIIIKIVARGGSRCGSRDRGRGRGWNGWWKLYTRWRTYQMRSHTRGDASCRCPCEKTACIMMLDAISHTLDTPYQHDIVTYSINTPVYWRSSRKRRRRSILSRSKDITFTIPVHCFYPSLTLAKLGLGHFFGP